MNLDRYTGFSASTTRTLRSPKNPESLKAQALTSCPYLPAGVYRSISARTASAFGESMPYVLLIVGTSPCSRDARISIESFGRFGLRTTKVETVSPVDRPLVEQLENLVAALALNKSLLADVMGVSRPTIYEWFAGVEPRASYIQRIHQLTRLLARSGVSAREPLNARFVRHPIGNAPISLLDALKSEDLDEPAIVAGLQTARERTIEDQRAREERETRARNRGFEDQSAEQRKQQLATTVAQTDWPKR